jgi:hypothetical protein
MATEKSAKKYSKNQPKNKSEQTPVSLDLVAILSRQGSE